MSRWFRHYAGMMRDDKLVSAAIRAKQSVERVVWVWGAILESASELNNDGHYQIDCAEVAYFLRADEADIRAIIDALAVAGRLDSDHVVKWSDRQFKSDRSAERQAKYRDKRRGEARDGDDSDPSPSRKVTSPRRHGDAPDTDYREQKDSSSTSVQVPHVGIIGDSTESRDQASRPPASLTTVPSEIYEDSELKGFVFEFDGLNVEAAIHELAHWTNRKGIRDPIERKNAIYGGLQKRHAKVKLNGALTSTTAVIVSPQLAASRLARSA